MIKRIIYLTYRAFLSEYRILKNNLLSDFF